jgi:hypothetical protein
MADITQIAEKTRNGELGFDRRHYALALLHGILQAQQCGYTKIAAFEFGVGTGGGLRSLVHCAGYFRDQFGMDIEVYGFDNATGLPQPAGYRDHPELWKSGEFLLGDVEGLRNSLPSWAHLIIGDIADTVPEFIKEFETNEHKIAFISVDVDFYSSTESALKILDMPPLNYVPAVPMYFDDINWHITFSKYAGQELAIEEFNSSHELRKLESKEKFMIENFYVCHVFDHPVRTGKEQPESSLSACAKVPGVVHVHNGSGLTI